MDTAIFEQISSALTVKSLYSPFGPDIQAGSTIDVESLVTDAGFDPFEKPSRVISSDGNVEGIVWLSDFFEFDPGEEPFVDDVMRRLEPDELLSSTTTILDAVGSFGRKPNPHFYVIHIDEVVGVIFYKDLFKPLGRLAFLALALEIEDQALSLCKSASLSQRCWRSLSDGRKLKALELFKLRYKYEPSLESDARKQATWGIGRRRNASDITLLLGCTNLVDKATMIWKQKLITHVELTEVLGFFRELREIRDQCAHPGGDDAIIPRERLALFVNSAKVMRNALRDSMKTHAVGLAVDSEVP